MNSHVSESAQNACDVVLDLSSPEQRLIMAMLAAPSGRHIWGEPAALVSAVSWDRFLSVADHPIRPYLHWVCERAPFASHIPFSVRETLASERFLAGVRNLRWKTELRQIIEAFCARRISLMVVKGAVLQRTVYPDPSTRPMSDIDLVVRRNEMAQTYGIFRDLGFHSRTSLEGLTAPVGMNADEEGFFYKQIADRFLLVEVHTRLEMEIPAYSGPPPPLWEHLVDVLTNDDIQVPTLDPNTALRHLCLHLAKHGFERGLRWLLDIRLFVEHHKTSIRWDEFIRGCDRQSAPLIAFTLSLAADWLGAEVPNFEAALPSDRRRMASSLAWGQIWDYVRTHQPPNPVAIMLSGDARRIWKYLRDRIRRWTSPIPDRKAHPLVLMGKRFRSDLRILHAAFREGGFSLSSIRTARRSDRRVGQMRKLFGLPLEK